MTTSEALEKLRKYCAYQERCHHDVRTKLLSLKIYGDQLEEVMAQLVKEGFLNELRYAKSFAGGKHRIKKWGRKKIIGELKKRHISNYCITKGLQEIDAELYERNLTDLLGKFTARAPKTLDKWKIKSKAFQYAISKGYEAEMINRILN